MDHRNIRSPEHRTDCQSYTRSYGPKSFKFETNETVESECCLRVSIGLFRTYDINIFTGVGEIKFPAETEEDVYQKYHCKTAFK